MAVKDKGCILFHSLAVAHTRKDTQMCTFSRAHEAWQLDDPPELVTFAKKMQLGGYYHTNDCKPRHSYRIFNTWMGDPARLALAEVIVKEIKENDLVKNAKEVGDVFLGGLKDLEV